MRVSVDELDRSRLAHRYRGLDVTTIAEAPQRTPVRVAGEIQSVAMVPRAGNASLEVMVSDGTARAVAVFLGRRRIAGLHPGTGVVLEGVIQEDRSRLVLLNPAYALIPASG